VFLIKDHIREWLPDLRFVMVTTVPLFLFALLTEPAVDIPPQAEVAHIRGPWFFVGIQALLRVMPAIWAGLILPSVFLIILLALPVMRGVWRKTAQVFIYTALILYLILTIREFFFYP
jgi:ubiquinol-cytochrome c reductase cytochrome b subunit